MYAMHNCVAHTIQEFAGHAGIASFVGSGMCRAGTGPDGHPIQADIAFTGLATGAVEGDRDVTVRNFVGGKLNIMHHSDVDQHGVIYGDIEDKVKKFAKPITDREIGGCMALVLNAGGGMSKDFSNLIYRLARKGTESVLGPAPASGNNNEDAALLQEHRMRTAGKVRRMQGTIKTVRVRGQVNLILRAPRAAVGGRAAPIQLGCGEFEF